MRTALSATLGAARTRATLRTALGAALRATGTALRTALGVTLCATGADATLRAALGATGTALYAALCGGRCGLRGWLLRCGDAGEQ